MQESLQRREYRALKFRRDEEVVSIGVPPNPHLDRLVADGGDSEFLPPLRPIDETTRKGTWRAPSAVVLALETSTAAPCPSLSDLQNPTGACLTGPPVRFGETEDVDRALTDRQGTRSVKTLKDSPACMRDLVCCTLRRLLDEIGQEFSGVSENAAIPPFPSLFHPKQDLARDRGVGASRSVRGSWSASLTRGP